ncbi:MAG TPA: aldehyde ferredoxin oxidoreductase family protein [Gemmataceae bacterium]|jgi:aldehyde:ferredoxin oxidoreductase|nr:aldehyde ferredoxin oxidoreductase family protein [Gemmataceae bacterium]
MFGYHGRYLRIDLTTGNSQWKPLAEDVLRRFVGGVGLATYLMHRECPAGVDPLAAEAPLIFCLSPLVGTPLTTSAKFAVVAKSPLTWRLNDALSSSHFAIAAKKAGFDALVVTGACSQPSVLVIRDGIMSLELAADLWGLSPSATEARLTERLGPRFQMAVIGPAGENLVRFATISHDNRHAGRGGLGAVMGSKKLKAIAVAGSQAVEVADQSQVVAAAKDLSKRSFGPATAKYRELGTVANLLTFNRLAALPTRNFQQSTFAEAADLMNGGVVSSHKRATEITEGTEGFSSTIPVRRSCAACTIGCEHIYAGSAGEVRLEYETLFALGPLCGIGDRDAVLRAARACDDWGLDTISTGACIAFAMECAEKGLLEKLVSGGVVSGEWCGKWSASSPFTTHYSPLTPLDFEDLRFGNAAALLSLIDHIGRREGVGDLLAEGTRRAAEVIGGDAPHFAPHVKGLEIPGYEPRALQTMALGFAVGSRGADHNRSGAYEIDFSERADRLHGTADSARLAVETEDRAALMDSLILCKFLRGVFTDLFAEGADLLSCVSGWDVSTEELHTIARRIVTAKKLFNIREGWTAAEDTLPKRFLSEGLPDGASGGSVLPAERLQEMIQAYYAARGWDSQGKVPDAIVFALDLADLRNTNPKRERGGDEVEIAEDRLPTVLKPHNPKV